MNQPSLTRHSEVGHLVRAVLKHPAQAFLSQSFIDAQWKALNFTAAPDFLGACDEFDGFVRLLTDHGVHVELLSADERAGIDSIYARDASLPTTRGVVIGQMGKALRSGEPTAQKAAFLAMGLSVAGEIQAPGRLEGGDAAWLDERTLLVGEGYRTNAAGIRQLRAILGAAIDVVAVPLPHWNGASDVMHLMSLISPVTTKAALVFSPLLPVPFRTWLIDRGISLIEVPQEEFDTMGGNVLAVGPTTVVALAGNPRTRAALEVAGITVVPYQGQEISVKGAGGPTCLTRPLERRA